MQRVLSIAAVCALLSAPMPAQDAPASYTRFLVPLHVFDVPGAYGSVWRSTMWLSYSGTEPAEIVPRPFCYSIQCLPGGLLEPGWAAAPFHHVADPRNGLLVYVDSRYSTQVTISSRIRDRSRTDESAGTEVPIIREDQLATTPLYLLNVPLEAPSRLTLRVYALPSVAPPEVDVRYYRLPDDTGSSLNLDRVLLRTDRIPLHAREGGAPGFQLYPAFAERGGLELLPEFTGERALWIEVSPVTPELRFWAFVSVTNNATQQVTLVTP